MSGQATPGGGALTYGNVVVDLEGAKSLKEFREGLPTLDLAQRGQIVEEAIKVLKGLYVHLFDKLDRYKGADPVGEFHTLAGKLGGASDPEFHNKMLGIFKSVRDLHTAYVPPAPFNRSIAFLPFQVEEYGGKDQPRYVVSNIIEGHPRFELPDDLVPGVEVTGWDGALISEAVELSEAENPGGNGEARRALGVDRLTARPLAKSSVPAKDFVTITYTSEQGAERSGEVRWHVAQILPAADEPPAELWRAMGQGLDHDREAVRWIRNSARAGARRPGARCHVRTVASAAGSEPFARPLENFPELPVHCEAMTFRAGSGMTYGYIRIRSFKVARHRSYVTKFARLLEAMPPDGVVIDVRDNPGGFILAAERLLQLLTPREIEPTTMQFISTESSNQITGLVPEYFEWQASISGNLEAAAVQKPPKQGDERPKLSADLPVSPVKMCNNVGQRYYGPVVLVVNALSYSATELFAAGFQDHGIGEVIGTDGSTGGGGGNVVTHSDLWKNFQAARKAASALGNEVPAWPLGNELPPGVDLRVAIRRPLRIKEPHHRERPGRKPHRRELEDFGVEPDCRHTMTRDDVLRGNRDLLGVAAGLLDRRAGERCKLQECGRRARPDDPITIKTSRFDRLDWSIDGGARGSLRVDVGGSTVEIDCRFGDPGELLLLEGYRDDAPVARRKIRLLPTE